MNVRSSRAAARAGFTLMEVMVVVAILVILAGTASVYFMRARDDALMDRAKIGVQTLNTAAGLYQIKFNDYPPALLQLVNPPDGSKPYVEMSDLLDPWGREYHYAHPGQHHQRTGLPDIWSDGIRPGDPTTIVGNWSAINQGL